jgi:hypothetical protein
MALGCDRRNRAYHEAGHAVVAHVCGLEIRHVRLDGESECPLRRRLSEVDVTICELTRRASLYEAGGIASARAGFHDPGAGADAVQSENLGEIARNRGLFDGELGDWVRQARDDARAILERHWSVVEAVAEALLERGFLSGPEAHALMQEGLGASAGAAEGCG